MDAVATAGSFLQMPMRYERVYDEYEVTGDTAVTRAVRPPAATAVEDSLARAACHAREDVEKISCRCRNGHCLAFRVNIPTDSAALISSAVLPPPFGAVNDTLISEGEMQELTRGLGQLPAAPWQFQVRRPRWGLARYNRVEGLALGARGELDLGRLRLDGTARIATSDAEPDLEGGVLHETVAARFRFAGYRRLAGVDPTARSLGIGNSLGALLLGRDDGDYFRATGAELTVAPPVTLPQRFAIRLYAESQRRAVKRTDFSVPHAIHDVHVFRPNITADSADQLGVSLTFRTQRGIDPALPQWTAGARAARCGSPRRSAQIWRAPSSWPAGWRTAWCRCRATGTSAGRAPCGATVGTRRAATPFGARGSSWRIAGRPPASCFLPTSDARVRASSCRSPGRSPAWVWARASSTA